MDVYETNGRVYSTIIKSENISNVHTGNNNSNRSIILIITFVLLNAVG